MIFHLPAPVTGFGGGDFQIVGLGIWGFLQTVPDPPETPKKRISSKYPVSNLPENSCPTRCFYV